MKINNISCKSCEKFTFCKSHEEKYKSSINKDGVWVGVMSPIRKCQHAIADKYYSKIHDKNVLEVGCGSSLKGNFIKKAIEDAGSKWSGIDIKKTDLTTKVCDVIAMPFENELFDCVIGNQTMEHWIDIVSALSEIRRVLKVDGKIILTVPIHLHGDPIFVTGDFNKIESLFNSSKLDIEVAEVWRKSHDGLLSYLPGESKKHLKKYNFLASTSYIACFVLRK